MGVVETSEGFAQSRVDAVGGAEGWEGGGCVEEGAHEMMEGEAVTLVDWKVYGRVGPFDVTAVLVWVVRWSDADGS